MKVSAVIVTRGDVDLGSVLAPILSCPEVDEVIIRRGHGGVLERWEAAAQASCDVVYTQDDDAIVDVKVVLAAYQWGKVACNMPTDRRPEYPDGIALVGWGSVFDKNSVTLSVTAFPRYRTHFPNDDDLFRREADRVFTGLSPLKLIDVPFRHLPYAHGNDRMGRRPEHGASMKAIRERIYQVRGYR